jgi:hypothetical protein
VRLFKSDDDRYAAAAIKALKEGLTTHGNPAGEKAWKFVAANLSAADAAAVRLACAAVELESAARGHQAVTGSTGLAGSVEVEP